MGCRDVEGGQTDIFPCSTVFWKTVYVYGVIDSPISVYYIEIQTTYYYTEQIIL